jgi:polyisoprenoid-binding protein YceI
MGDTSSTATGQASVVGSWRIDTEHSSVEFSVRNKGILRAKGAVPIADGTVVVDPSPSRSDVEVRLDVAGFDTGNPKRDKHVRSSEFLDVEGFPYMTFRGVDLCFDQHDPVRAELDGELTVHGVARLVTLSVRLEVMARQGDEPEMARFTAGTIVRRSDFGVIAMRGMVGDQVRVRIALTLRRSETATGRADDDGSPE